MKTDVEALRKKYMDNPPEGLTSTDIRHMSEEDLLDMDYFLNDDNLDVRVTTGASALPSSTSTVWEERE